jgi:PTS system mannose-specific IIB component
VVSDEVANDQLRKFLLKEAAPPGIKSNVVTVAKMLEVAHNTLFNTQKVMLLFTNPQDVVTLVKGGIDIRSVNIGGMSFSMGKRMITNFVSVNDQDLASLLYLQNQGIEVEIRKVPADRKIFLKDILEKEGSHP